MLLSVEFGLRLLNQIEKNKDWIILSVFGFALIVNVCNVAFAVSHTETTMTLVVPRKFEPKKFSGAPFGIQTVR